MNVLPPPLLDDDWCLLQDVEDFSVEQLIAELAVEALNIAILPRAARLDEQSLRAQLVQSSADLFIGELRAIVTAVIFGDTALAE